MANEKRIEKLQSVFNSIKNKGSASNVEPLVKVSEKVIVPMISIDINVAIDMWEYLINHYSFIKNDYAYHYVTKHIVNMSDACNTIKIIEKSNIIRNAVFSRYGYDEFGIMYDFYAEVLFERKYDLFELVMNLIISNYTNDRKISKAIYDVLDVITADSKVRWNIDEQGIEILYSWANKITTKSKKNIILLQIDELKEIAEGNAPKGAISLDMLSQPDILDELITQKTNASRTQKQSIKKQNKETISVEKKSELLQNSLKELNNLVGLDNVKKDVNDLINLLRVQELRKERGLNAVEISKHLVFSGNPGTGKTTVARILGKLYCGMGLLSKGHLIEVDRSGLVAGYVGQTALKTQGVIEDALGGILFIDEAYSLAIDGIDNDYGKEAIECILKAMEDNRDDFVVIVAGYSDLMEKFIESNPGLKSRFNKYIEFNDYTSDELHQIFHRFLDRNLYIISDEADYELKLFFQQMYINRRKNFGNARDVRNIFEKIVSCQANRIVNIDNPSNEDIMKIVLEDVLNIK